MNVKLKPSLRFAATTIGVIASATAHATTIGTPLTPEISVATSDRYTAGSTVVTDASGNFTVVWKPDVSAAGVSQPYAFRRFAYDGTALTPIVQLDASSAFSVAVPAAGMDSAGDLAVAWTCNDTSNNPGRGGSSGICAQVFAPDGTAKGAVITVDRGPAESTKSQGSFNYTVDLAMAPNGDFTVGWSGADFYGTGGGGSVVDTFTTSFIKTRGYNVSGEPYSAAKTVAFKAFLFSKSMRLYHANMVGSPSGNYLVTWVEEHGFETGKINTLTVVTKGKFFSASGKATSGSLTLLDQTAATRAGDAIMAPVFSLTDTGDVLYAYEKASSGSPGVAAIYLQRCSAACTSKSAPVEVGARAYPTSPDSGGLALSATSDGGAFVTWGDPSTNVVFARAFSPDNVALSSAFPVGSNPLPAYYVYGDANLSTTIDSNGNLVVAWGSLSARVFQGH